MEQRETLKTKKPTTKEKIRNAALALFYRKGFDGSSLREIAINAGLNHQKITYHFQTKENLFLTVLEQSFNELIELSQSLVFNPVEMHPIDQFRRHAKEVAYYFLNNPAFIHIIYQESLNNSPRLLKIKPFIEKYKNNILRELLYLKEFGFGANITTEQLLIIFSGGFHARFIHPYMNEVIRGKPKNDKKEVDEYIDALCSVLTSPSDKHRL